MDIRRNNFFLLKASLDDSRHILVKRASDLEFELGEEICQKCLTDLINPKRRIFSEIRWFIYETETEIQNILTGIENGDPIDSVTSNLSAINTIDYWYKFDNKNISSQLKYLSNYYYASQGISCEDILNSINNHRLISGFTEATFSDVSAELNSYLSELESRVLDAVFSFGDKSQADLVLRFALQIASIDNPYPEWGLPQAILSRYELLHGDAIMIEEQGIIKYVNAERMHYGMYSQRDLFDQINIRLDRWRAIANPINYVNFTKGVYKRSSMSMLQTIQEFILFLNNNKNDYTGALDLIRILSTHCEYFPGIKENLEGGISTIKNNQQVKVKNERQKKVQGAIQAVRIIGGIIFFIFLLYTCSL